MSYPTYLKVDVFFFFFLPNRLVDGGVTKESGGRKFRIDPRAITVNIFF